MARLGDVATFFSGTGFPNVFQGQKIGKYPFYKVGDISKNVFLGNRTLMVCDNYVDENIVEKINGKLIPPETIVFAKIGEALRLNRRAITQCHCLIDNNAMGVQVNNSILDTMYFYYFMCNIDLQNYCESTTVPSVRKTRIQEIEIDIPPLDEQRKIAAVLDKISDLIVKRRQQLDKLDLLIKSKFVEMFGQEKQQGSISDICSIITDGTHQPPKFITNGIPFLFVSNIVSNEITYETEKYISQETYDELIKRTPIEIGDVLLSTVGSYGHPAIVKDSKKFLFQRHIAYLKPKQDMVVSSYLHAALLSYDVQHQIEEKVKGVAQKTLNLSEIRKITLPIPTIERQLSFCKYIEQTEKTKEMIKQSLEKLETLKKALMQKYFG